ncbi:DUF6882 domain-containing protein [Actinocorallia sp. A-T 12471]|uniref:DUF6882 domain-containing protein n=1 Tax=Actinocorallia sp. A-T 12471 TaxID=3089813 RepID=UPI0029D02434|nr:DUF6882 domain-containing protein [Actinocorallia sp. A-T 12471]MDX6743053.1 hypothetical protein [Actinocorallia sp. A-T 12471]
MSGFSSAFERLGAALSAIVLAQQETLAARLPRADWSADLNGRTYTSGGTTVRVGLLGSYASRERTWLWGWANAQFGPDHPAVAPTLAVREIGARLAVPEFTSPEVDLSWFEGGHAGHLIAVAAAGVLGGSGYIGAGYEGGSAYLLVDDPAIPPAAFDPAAVPALIAKAVSLFPADPQLTLTRLLAYHHVPFRRSGARTEARLPGGATATADFTTDPVFTHWATPARV